MRIQNSFYKGIQGAAGKFRNNINVKKDYFTKEIEIMKKNQIGILELKNSDEQHIRKHWEYRADHMEGGKNELQDRNLEMIQVEKERELRFLKVKKSYKSNQTPL